jgi:SAM-dependent methyltransferase
LSPPAARSAAVASLRDAGGHKGRDYTLECSNPICSSMRPDDVDALKRDLIGFRAELEEPGVRAELIETALPRILATLEMIPDSYRDKAILELGSSPYFLSLCLYRMCAGTLKRGNYFGPDAKHGADRLVHQASGETVVFAYEAFNIENDPFPYADESFDAVVFSELIEHLGVNPVRALAEIHRVLRPGGIVIVTTPNSLSLERFADFVRAGSLMEERYSPLFGYGARHNREYHPRELRELLEGTGFVIEELVTRDLIPPPRDAPQQSALRRRLGVAGTALALAVGAQRLETPLWQRLLGLYTDVPRRERYLWQQLMAHYGETPREEHIFLRARRGERFRWSFPATLFDNIQFYTLVKYPWMEMGINDSIQCSAGWYPLERGADGVELRWISGPEGQGFLKTPQDFTAFGAEVLAPAQSDSSTASLRAIVWDRWLGRVQVENVYVDAEATVERGRWQTIRLPIAGRRPRPGDEVEVKIQPAIPGERERGLAVRRFWYE